MAVQILKFDFWP